MLERFLLNWPSRRTFYHARKTSKMQHSYYEAIEALNRLQTNREYLAQALEHPTDKLKEFESCLNESGLHLEQIDKIPIIHVTGTKGKGSTCSFCDSILRAHGYSTGFFSSPHLLEARERIRLNGKPISQEKFAHYFWKLHAKLENTNVDLRYFKFLTILAFHIFVKEKVDVAILEVGIGGEYDFTNIVRNTVVAGITPLDLDHTKLLGNCLESIAWQKGGIMKPGSQVFTCPQPEGALNVLRLRSEEKQCNLHVIKDIYQDNCNTNVPPLIQSINASLAIAITRSFIELNPKDCKFNSALAEKAIETTKWPGRYEIISRRNSIFYLDGAHTSSSMKVCTDWYLSKTSLNDKRKKVLVFNMIGERNTKSFLKQLHPCDFDRVIFVPNVGFDNDTLNDEIARQLQRCQDNRILWDSLSQNNNSKAEIFESFPKVLEDLESTSQVPYNVLVTGSIHLVGAAMSVLDPQLGGLL